MMERRLLSAGLLLLAVRFAAPINPGRDLVVHYCCPDLALFNTTSGTCDTRQTDAEWLPPWTHRNGSRMTIGPGTVYTLIHGLPQLRRLPLPAGQVAARGRLPGAAQRRPVLPFYNTTVPSDESCIVEVAGAADRLHFAVVCMDSIKLPGPKKEGPVSQMIRTWVYPAPCSCGDLQGRTIICTLISLFMAYLMFIIVTRPATSSALEHASDSVSGLFPALLDAGLILLAERCVAHSLLHHQALGRPHAGGGAPLVIYLSVFGWCAPLLFTLAAVIVDFSPSTSEYLIRPHIASTSCWFGNRNAELAYFFGPVTLLIVANVVLFVMSAINIYKNMDGAQKLDDDGEHKGKSRLKMCFKVFFVMGITWVFEVLQFFINDSTEIWILFDILNMLQGFFIFVAVVLSDKRVRQKLMERLSQLGCWKQKAKATTDITRLDEEIGQNRSSEEVF
ncbi:uncharacterized protein LOC119094436 [Pollicipes pollicipes]|uniref:uncharacterized protein LOC119094436 n=1 Tax=Pollicipes pollicipes TaxID=41117 RepID=UPI00188512F1|nr:uncharacterized protein LOC119094436 [Pollicipes pollicipes]